MATKASELKPGRIYSFRYDAAVEMVQKRDGQHNPLQGAVSVVRVCKVQAAGNETYANVQRKKNPDWEPSAGRTAWYHALPDNTCIVEHNKTCDRYLRAIPRGITSETYFIDGTEATPVQVETIRQFKKRKDDREPEFILFRLENIANLVDDTDTEFANERD